MAIGVLCTSDQAGDGAFDSTSAHHFYRATHTPRSTLHGGTPSGQLGFGICVCVLRVFYLTRFSHRTVPHEELSLESRSSGVFQVDPEADRLGVHGPLFALPPHMISIGSKSRMKRLISICLRLGLSELSSTFHRR